MRSSISSSDVIIEESPRTELAVLERPREVSPPLPHDAGRPVPVHPWLRIFVTVASVTLLLMVAWEMEMRHLGLRAGDLDDERADWAAERRKVDASPRDSVVIIGDS